MKTTILIFLFILFANPALAAGSELTSKLLLAQIANFSLFVLAGYFLLKNPLQALFHKRQKDFFDFEKQAAGLEKEKQVENDKWKKQLAELEKKEKNIESQAQAQAQKFQEQKRQELKELEQSLKRSSDFLIRLETEKIKKSSLSYWRKSLVKKTQAELLKLAESKNFQDQEVQSFLNLLKKSG